MGQQIETPVAVTVSTVWTTLLAMILGGDQGQVRAEIENVGTVRAFSDFRVQAQDHPDGEWYTYLSAGEIEATIAPGTLATMTKTHVVIPLVGLYAIRLQAKVAADTTTAAVKGLAAKIVGQDEIVSSLLSSEHTGLGSKAVGAAWDADSNELTIPDGARHIVFMLTADAYIILNSLTANPGTDGCVYLKYVVYRLPCKGCTKLHYKRLSADGTLYASSTA